jgi:hypothetical protein
MKLKLLAPHVVPVGPHNDRWCPAGTILDPAPPNYQATPLMEGLDDESRAAVDFAKLKAWGRYPWTDSRSCGRSVPECRTPPAMWLPPRPRRWRWHASVSTARSPPTWLIVSGGSAAIVSGGSAADGAGSSSGFSCFSAINNCHFFAEVILTEAAATGPRRRRSLSGRGLRPTRPLAHFAARQGSSDDPAFGGGSRLRRTVGRPHRSRRAVPRRGSGRARHQPGPRRPEIAAIASLIVGNGFPPGSRSDRGGM